MTESFLATAPHIAWKGADDPRFTTALQSVTVTQSADGLDHAELALVNWGERDGGEPDYVFQDLKLGDEISVEMGGDPRAVVFRGHLTALEERHGYDGPPLLILLAENAAHKLARIRKSRAFADQSIDDIVGTLAQEAGLQTDVQVSSATGTWHQLNESNLAFIRRLVQPFHLPIRVVDNRTLRIRPHQPASQPIEMDTRRQAMRVRMSADLNHQYRTLRTAGYNLATAEAVDASATALSPPPSGSTAASTLADLGWESEANQPQPFISTQTLADDYAKAGFNHRGGGFIKGDISCEGRPDFAVDGEIKLSGVTPRLEGVYAISRCIHRFDTRNGYGCFLSVARGDWQP